MIEWVRDAAILWGIQARRAQLGGYYYGDNKFHFDGAAAASVMGKVFEGGGSPSQHFAEVYTGDALLFWRASQGLREERRALLTLKFVIPKQSASMKQKINALIDLYPSRFKNRHAVYDELDRTFEWIAARWPVPHETNCPDNIPTQCVGFS